MGNGYYVVHVATGKYLDFDVIHEFVDEPVVYDRATCEWLVSSYVGVFPDAAKPNDFRIEPAG